MADNIAEKADTLYWTTLSLKQLGLYRQNNEQIPPISFNLWEKEGIIAGHKHLDDLLGNVQTPTSQTLYPFQWSDSHILVSVEEPHTYFERDSFTEGSLENKRPIPLRDIVVELVGYEVPHDALGDMKLSKRVDDYYQGLSAQAVKPK